MIEVLRLALTPAAILLDLAFVSPVLGERDGCASCMVVPDTSPPSAPGALSR